MLPFLIWPLETRRKARTAYESGVVRIRSTLTNVARTHGHPAALSALRFSEGISKDSSTSKNHPNAASVQSSRHRSKTSIIPPFLSDTRSPHHVMSMISTKNWNASNNVVSWGVPTEPPVRIVSGSLVEPETLDIILGRGMLHVNHPGNLRFYAIIDSYIPRYIAADGKFMKGDIIHAIYKEVRRSARFVREEASLACCVVVDEDMARKKIGHAMRYRLKRARLLAEAWVPPALPPEDWVPAALPLEEWVPAALPPEEEYSQEESDLFIDEDLDSVLGSPSECAFLVGQEGNYFPVSND